jgi:arylsulfatase A-like enzyme/Flp pilus assembly protein TadD
MKARTSFLLIAAGAVILAALAYFLFLRRGPAPVPVEKAPGSNVIVITLDTTRADSLACYGCKNVETPTIDTFAARGVRFEKCYAQAPLTVPSHTTLFTGTQPIFHGVRDNAGFSVPQKLVTMAELFKGQGYETGAFIGAWILDSHCGLDQGFDTYSGGFELSRFHTQWMDEVQRPANEVMDQALPWLEARKDKKLFAWIHLYDPHAPYEPPPPYDKLYAAHPYLGEIAFADSQLQRLWQFLDTSGLLSKTFIIFAGDHGESLGEHREQTHGFFIYQATIRVPLIIVTPFRKFQGVVAREVAGLVDVLPTVCEMTGLPVPADVQGKSLLPAFSGRPGNENDLAYSESYYPRLHFGWSELKSVQNERYQLILAPVPELYDVVADPREEKNLVYADKELAEKMRAEAETLIKKASQNAYETAPTAIDAETREKLSSLGYVGSFTDTAGLRGGKLADPKDKIVLYEELSRARKLSTAGRADDAIRIIQSIIARDPETTAAAYEILGESYIAKKDWTRAEENIRKALELDPQLMDAHYRMGLIAEKQGRFKEAEAEYLKDLEVAPSHFEAVFGLAQVYHETGDSEKEAATLQKCLAADPNVPLPYLLLAQVYLSRGERYSEAVDLVRKGIDLKPERAVLPAAYSLLAKLYHRLGDDAQARECARQARALASELKTNK